MRALAYVDNRGTDSAARVLLPATEGGPIRVSGLRHPIVRAEFSSDATDHSVGRSALGVARKPYTPALPNAPSTPLILYDGPLPGSSDSLRYETSTWFSTRTRRALP